MEKTLIFRVIVNESDVEEISEICFDALAEVEDSIVIGPTVREATDKESKKFKKEIGKK